MIKVNEKLQQPRQGRVAKGTETPGMKLWATSPEIGPSSAEVFAEGRGNTKWVAAKVMTSFRKYNHKWHMYFCHILLYTHIYAYIHTYTQKHTHVYLFRERERLL